MKLSCRRTCPWPTGLAVCYFYLLPLPVVFTVTVTVYSNVAMSVISLPVVSQTGSSSLTVSLCCVCFSGLFKLYAFLLLLRLQCKRFEFKLLGFRIWRQHHSSIKLSFRHFFLTLALIELFRFTP